MRFRFHTWIFPIPATLLPSARFNIHYSYFIIDIIMTKWPIFWLSDLCTRYFFGIYCRRFWGTFFWGFFQGVAWIGIEEGIEGLGLNWRFGGFEGFVYKWKADTINLWVQSWNIVRQNTKINPPIIQKPPVTIQPNQNSSPNCPKSPPTPNQNLPSPNNPSPQT